MILQQDEQELTQENTGISHIVFLQSVRLLEPRKEQGELETAFFFEKVFEGKRWNFLARKKHILAENICDFSLALK